MAIQSLVFSSKADDKSGADEAGSQYELAALFVEFMRESKFGKAKFPEYICAVGAVPRNHVKAIDAAIQRVYGVDLAELEAQFVDYCKKR
jgi:glycyl-tRNA synthetase (class II)